jgi:D-proline reductase (dithiol) PrdB
VGLIQRTLEANGIATISITLSQEISRKVKPPRAVFTGFPLGHPLGFPGQRFRQLQLLRFLLQQMETLDTPGSIVVENMASEQDPAVECVLCGTIGEKKNRLKES